MNAARSPSDRTASSAGLSTVTLARFSYRVLTPYLPNADFHTANRAFG